MKQKGKSRNIVIVALIIFCLTAFFSIWRYELKKNVKAVNVFCGEWKVIDSQSVEGGKGCMEEGEVITICEREVKIENKVLSNVLYDSTLTVDLRGKEYDILFREYGYDCPFIEEKPKGNYFLYVIVSNSEKKFGFYMSESDELLIRYGESVYYCERISEEKNSVFQEFPGICRVHDWGLDGGEVYEGEWIIKDIVENGIFMDENLIGKSIYFFRPDLGKIRILYDGKMYREIDIKMDIMSGQQKYVKHKNWDELGLTEVLISYVQFNLEKTDIHQLKGMYVISADKILLVTKSAIYLCIRNIHADRLVIPISVKKEDSVKTLDSFKDEDDSNTIHYFLKE